MLILNKNLALRNKSGKNKHRKTKKYKSEKTTTQLPMYAELPYHQYEQLIEVIEKMRNSRKRSFARKAKHINPICLIQNQMRKKLKQIKPFEMKQVEDNYTGVDYIYNQTKIDQKFSFGDLGENAIIIRTKNRRLLNASDWTMIINKNEKIEFFETKKLADFVRKNWGIVQKNLIEKNWEHEKYKICLDEFYSKENVCPIETQLEENNLCAMLNNITKEQIDSEKKICILPLICELQ